MSMEQLIGRLIEQGYLKTPLIIEAFKNIKREDFVLEKLKDEADINAPLPIGYDQTISQPLTVAFMLELLQPKPGEKILDVGSGSAWQTGLLAYCVGNPPAGGGKVFGIERIPGLVEFGKKNISKYNYIEKEIVEFVEGDGGRGLSKQAPFDKIIVAAAAEEVPEELKKQLKVGGRLVIPIKSSIWLFIKNPPIGGRTRFEEKEFSGFAFVPLIER